MITSPGSSELSSPESFANYITRFEAGDIDISEWTHAAHVAMGGGLAQQADPEAAIVRMREGIQRLLAHNNIQTTILRGYHESITRLWIYVCHTFLVESRLTGLEAVRALVACYGHRSSLHREFWSYDVVTSEPARATWQPPDLQPVPAAWRSGERWVSCNPKYLDVEQVHRFLAGTYWSPEIPRSVVQRAIRGSLTFGVYAGQQQVGFARVITDLATYAYIADVFVLEEWRGQGLSVWLMDCILNHPSLQGFRRWQLATRDAHGLYQKFGFAPPANPSTIMEIVRRDIYRSG